MTQGRARAPRRRRVAGNAASPTSQIARVRRPDGSVVPVLLRDGRALGPLSEDLASLLRLPLSDLRQMLSALGARGLLEYDRTLAPIDGRTEVWAAGVTYKRSEEARVEESATPDIYTRVYRAERPELFFKADARRVAGPDQPIAVRVDSTWDVPEPELAIVVNAAAEIIGYTIANDVSSRSIEGENPLYLPQAKVYAGSCALGPGIVPAWEIDDPYALGIRMRIERNGAELWHGETSMREFARRLEDLVSYLFRADTFPDGAIISTGTALVPESPFTLQGGDVVEIEIDSLGTLRNPVVQGKAALR